MATRSAQAESIGASDRTFATIDRAPDTANAPAYWWTTFTAPNAASAPAAATFSATAFQPWSQGYANLLAFYQLRLRKDFETLAGMTLCRTPQQVGALWMRAACEAASDYAEAFGTVAAKKE